MTGQEPFPTPALPAELAATSGVGRGRLAGPAHGAHRAGIRAAAHRLQALPGVTHVTIGEKIRGGRDTGEKALKVHVIDKHRVAPEHAVPRHVLVPGAGGRPDLTLPTDVIAVGAAPQLFAAGSGDMLQAFDRDRGVATIGLHKGANAYVLTNAHVAMDLATSASGAVSVLDRTMNRWNRLGAVALHSPLPPPQGPAQGQALRDDCAFIRAEDPVLVADGMLATSPPVPIARMDNLRSGLGQHWFVAGEIYICDQLEPLPTDASVTVDGVTLRYTGVWQARMVQGQSHAGISGALLCRTVDRQVVACGQVFGGIPGDYVWAFPFQSIMDRYWASLP